MMDHKPVVVLPLHDPSGILFFHLEQTLPFLKRFFAGAYVSISPATADRQESQVARLQSDSFFRINFNDPGSLPGEHFLSAYRQALEQCAHDQVLHLCDFDKIAAALGGPHRPLFLNDIRTLETEELPLLFQRSATAWETYPQNYREVEQLAIKVGRLLFGRYLDFAWSYLVLRATTLQEILPQVQSKDFGVLVEIVLLLRERLHTKNVDWLAWEDPYILQQQPDRLREERASSPQETRKRLQAILPFFRHFREELPPLQHWER